MDEGFYGPLFSIPVVSPLHGLDYPSFKNQAVLPVGLFASIWPSRDVFLSALSPRLDGDAAHILPAVDVPDLDKTSADVPAVDVLVSVLVVDIPIVDVPVADIPVDDRIIVELSTTSLATSTLDDAAYEQLRLANVDRNP